jgi:hypothetical protein
VSSHGLSVRAADALHMDWRRLLQCAQTAATRHAAGTGQLQNDDVAADVSTGASTLHALHTLQVRYSQKRVAAVCACSKHSVAGSANVRCSIQHSCYPAIIEPLI